MILNEIESALKLTGEADVNRGLDAVTARAKAVADSLSRAEFQTKEFSDALARMKSTPEGMRQLNAEIQSSNAAWRNLARVVDVSSAEEVRAIRGLAVEQRAWLSAIGATDAQMQKFEASVASFDKRVTAAAKSTGGIAPGARSAANGLSALAFAALSTEPNLRSMALSAGLVGTSLADTFGSAAVASYAAGIGAVIVLGVALVGVFERVTAAAKPADEVLSHIANLDRISTAATALQNANARIEQIQDQITAENDKPILSRDLVNLAKLQNELDAALEIQRSVFAKSKEITSRESKEIAAARLDAVVQGRQAENSVAAAKDSEQLAREAATFATGKLNLDAYYADRIASIERNRAREVAALTTERGLRSRAVPGETPAEALARAAQAARITQQILDVDHRAHEQVIREIEERRQKREALDRAILGFELREAETSGAATAQRIAQLRQEANEFARLLVQRGASEADAFAKSQAWLQAMTDALDPLRQRFNAAMRQLEQEGTGTAKAIAEHLREELAKNGGTIDISFVLHAEAVIAAGKVVDDQFKQIGSDAGATFADAIGAAFAGLGSGAGFFKSFGNTILQGLGSIFTQMGKALLVYGATMMGLLPALLNPFTSGPAALAAGAALIALGGLLGGIASGRGSATGGGGRSASSVSAAALGPTQVSLGPRAAPIGSQGYTVQGVSMPRGMLANAPQPLTVHVTNIGRLDLDGETKITQAVMRGMRRGVTANG